ncbi:DNA polymerase III subunit beta [bacterium]|nr:DNA polymerase III subunit beta [bacterium]
MQTDENLLLDKNETPNPTANMKKEPQPSPGMQFQVQTELLLKELQLLVPLADQKSTTLPVLRNVLISAKKSTIHLVTSNLETAMESEIPAEVTTEGQVTADAKDLLRILRAAGEVESIELSVDVEHQTLHVEFDSTEFELPTLPPDEFPALPSITNKKSITVPTEVLKRGIGAVLFVIPAEDIRYAMNGALVKFDGNSITFVGTDGHRLAFINPRTDSTITRVEKEAIISGIALQQLARLISNCDAETVQFTLEASYGLFRIGSRTLLFRLIEAQFPEYEKFISLKNPFAAVLNTSNFILALENVTVIAGGRTPITELNIKNSQLEVTWCGQDGSNAATTIAAVYQGEEMQIGFNSNYLLEFLRSIDSDETVIELSTNTTAALLRPNGGNPDGQKYVVMPIRL